MNCQLFTQKQQPRIIEIKKSGNGYNVLYRYEVVAKLTEKNYLELKQTGSCISDAGKLEVI